MPSWSVRNHCIPELSFISSLACPGDGFGIWFDTDCLHRFRNYSKSLLLGDHGYYQTRPQYSSDYCQWLFIDFSIKTLEAWEPLSTYRDWRAWYCRKTYSYNQYLYFDSQFFRHHRRLFLRPFKGNIVQVIDAIIQLLLSVGSASSSRFAQ